MFKVEFGLSFQMQTFENVEQSPKRKTQYLNASLSYFKRTSRCRKLLQLLSPIDAFPVVRIKHSMGPMTWSAMQFRRYYLFVRINISYYYYCHRIEVKSKYFQSTDSYRIFGMWMASIIMYWQYHDIFDYSMLVCIRLCISFCVVASKKKHSNDSMTIVFLHNGKRL